MNVYNICTTKTKDITSMKTVTILFEINKNKSTGYQGIATDRSQSLLTFLFLNRIKLKE